MGLRKRTEAIQIREKKFGYFPQRFRWHGREFIECELQRRAALRKARQRFVIDAERRERAQPASDSGNRSQNRYDQQTNVREHWTSLNTRAIREKSRLTKLRDHGEGAANGCIRLINLS